MKCPECGQWNRASMPHCTRCGAPLNMTRGIEAGQVFMLGTKYSKALGATFLDESGKEKPLVMGCYGIGVGRTMAAAIEQNNDKDGVIWPKSIAPFEVVVVPVNAKVPEQLALAESIYEELKKAGVDVLLAPEFLSEAAEALLSAVEDGRLSESRIDESVSRILNLKEAYGLLG